MKSIVVFGVLFVALLAVGFVSATCTGTSGNGQTILKTVPYDPVCTLYQTVNGQQFCMQTAYKGAYAEVSVNSGVSWTNYSIDDNFGYFSGFYQEAFAVDNTGKVMFASTQDGVWRSTNFGQSWTKILSSGYPAICVSNDDAHVYVSGGNFMYSENQGASWITVDSPVNPPTFIDLSLVNGARGYNVYRDQIHTGGNLMGVSPDGKYVVVASYGTGGAFGGWAWQSNNFGHSMNAFGDEEKYAGIAYSPDFQTVVLASIGGYEGGACVSNAGILRLSNDFGQDWITANINTVGYRGSWQNIQIVNSQVTVDSTPPASYGTGCIGIGGVSAAPPRQDVINAATGDLVSTQALSQSQINALTGMAILPYDKNISYQPALVGWILIVVLAGLMVYLIARPKTWSKKRRKR